MPGTPISTTSPVAAIDTDDLARVPDPGTGLCLSGGGYRAMVFHIGALWRLYEADMLRDLKRISSVSGGSITAGALALAWPKLSFNPARLQDDFVPNVVAPLRSLAGETIDADAIVWGLLSPGRISDRVAKAYDEHIFHGATLQNLPDAPRFVINATNVQSGVLWRFMKPYMRDYRVGEVKNPKISLAQAVTASSAFPPVLSPFEMRLDPRSFTPGSGFDLQKEPYTKKVILTDGGVYDNLGLETVWKHFQTVLVSDGGGLLAAEEEPKSNWAEHSYRVLNLIDNQVRARRKLQVVESFKTGARKGGYWGIWTPIDDYKLPSALPCPRASALQLAETPTRLARMDDLLQERLINWGYAVCDAAIRKYANPAAAQPKGFPYPAVGV